MHTVSKIIHALRAKGFTGAEIARKTGMSEARVCRWAQGSDCSSADDALKLLEMLNWARGKRRSRA